MRNIILGVLALILLGVWTVHADLSDWLFCSVNQKQVTISLKQSTWFYKCHDTIIALEHLIVATAKDLIKIQTYITNGRDVDYRKTIHVQKQSLLDTLQLTRISVINNMKNFTNNLFQKSVQYFIIKITPYKISLQKSLVKIQILVASGFSTPALDTYALLLKAQVAVIEKIGSVTTQEDLISLLKQYVYLKNEIEWKSE